MNHEVEILFHELAGLPPEKRENYLLDRHVTAEIRAEVNALLRFDSATGGDSLTDCVAASAERCLEADVRFEAGARCGPYRLLRVLGRGGMGSVYLAERVDGEVEQRVAIKLLRHRADEPAFLERFLRERQIMATLSHPGIVRLMDVGHMDNGQPYLATEYIDGVAVDVFAAGLELRGKLELFLKICEAVSYAHRNLVIHRDIKPSNVLVEASGEPKLLDFGIAKILAAVMDQTVAQERLLTPAFASPEQVLGKAQATTSDVYSLGAVLYMLLAGRSPHNISTQSQEAIEFAVCSTEPVAPTDLNRALPRDLDFIVLKALRKEPDERYGSADAFAADILAFLESRPVRARSGNTWYRTRKFLRRYWVTVAAAALVVASLSAGLYVANRERALAQRRFMEVRQLANKLFDIDALARQLPGSTKTRQLIVDTSLEYLGRLSADVKDDPGLSLEVGTAYMWVARVQGVPISSNLGQIDKAGQNLRLADGFIQSALESQPWNRTALLRAAEIARDRMILADIDGRDEEANECARKTVAGLEKFNAQKSDQPEAAAILQAYQNVAERYQHAQLADDALGVCRRGSQLAQTFGLPAVRGSLLRIEAKVFQGRGDLDEALKSIHESAALLQLGPADNDQSRTLNLVMSLVYEGEILGGDNAVGLGRPEEAVAALERAFKIADDRVHQDPNDQNTRGKLEMAGYPLANILRHSDARRALSVYDHTLRHLAEVRTNANVQLYEARALAGSSYPLRSLGRPAEARERLDAAFKRLLQLKMYPADKIWLGSGAHRTLSALADYEAENGNIPRAAEIYRELLDKTASSKPGPETSLEDALDLSSIYTGMAAVHHRAGQAERGSALEARRLELWRRWERKLPNNPFVLRQIAAKPAR